MHAILPRWGSPAGLLLAGLLFLLLPTVAVSCSGPSGQLDVTATGADLLTSGRPGIDAGGGFALDEFTPDSYLAGDLDAASAPAGVQVLTVMLLAVLVAGVVLGVRQRPKFAVGAAVAGAALVVFIEMIMAARWRPLMSAYGALVRDLPEARGRDAAGEAAAAVHAGLGFWLSLVGLLVAAIVSLPAIVRKRTAD